jgi:8-oxoguanine deaminase
VDKKRALWIKDPLGVLADEAERGVVIQEGRIAELVPAGRTPVTSDITIFEAGAHVVVPGLINTHHHFYQTLTRATPAALDRELFPWLQALYPIWAGLTPEALELAATVAMSELLLSGCSTTTDHHYLFPGGLGEAIDIEIAAANKLGIRVVLTRGSMNLSQRDGGLPPESVVQDEDTILADSRRLIDRYHQRGEDAMVQIALAPCAPFSVTTSLMRSTADLAAQTQVRLHTHLAETEDENRYSTLRIVGGWASELGSRTEFISAPTKCRGWRGRERQSAIALAATRCSPRAAVQSAIWSWPAFGSVSVLMAPRRTTLPISFRRCAQPS